ncbi:MAG: hypothetical protein ABIH90_02370 [Candidatus Aenigmatarchaeota archaeon]
MEISFNDQQIELRKETNVIDDFVTDMASIVSAHFRYAIVSGYIPILFGKIRATEDIDFFIDAADVVKFPKFCEEFSRKGYYILNAASVNDALALLKAGDAIRVAENGHFAPNAEIKIAKDVWGKRALNERLKISINSKSIYIGKIEQGIAYKLYLGSRKDIDDACHMYLLFTGLGKLDKKRLEVDCKSLGVSSDILEECKNGQ